MEKTEQMEVKKLIKARIVKTNKSLTVSQINEQSDIFQTKVLADRLANAQKKVEQANDFLAKEKVEVEKLTLKLKEDIVKRDLKSSQFKKL